MIVSIHMDWIHHFQLFLLDFDGLLVDTESIHYQAYLNILIRRGHPLPLSFADFLQLAHANATAWKEALYQVIPNLEPNWDLIYREKKAEYIRLVEEGKVDLMPGVETLLRSLEKANIRRCVVTHSLLESVDPIRRHLPVLSETLPHWVTRADYNAPKPSPDGYWKAIELYGKEGDRIIGFEDSIRGLQALQQTPATPVLICSSQHPLLKAGVPDKAFHFETFPHLFLNATF